MALKTALTKVGFGAQMRFRSLLEPPRGATGSDNLIWDYFQDGRLAMLYPTLQQAQEQTAHGDPNIFMANADLFQRQVVPGPISIIDTAEMLNMTEGETWLSPAARSAQRGPSWHEALLNSLLCSPPHEGLPGVPWVTVHDHLDVLELHPHLGDGAMATNALRKDSKFPCSFRHFLPKMGYKGMAEATDLCVKRLVQDLEQPKQISPARFRD